MAQRAQDFPHQSAPNARRYVESRASHCPLRFGCITENSFPTRSNSRTRYAFAHSRATSRRCRRSYLHISTAADHEVQCDLINPFSNVCTAEAAVKLTDGSRLAANTEFWRPSDRCRRQGSLVLSGAGRLLPPAPALQRKSSSRRPRPNWYRGAAATLAN